MHVFFLWHARRTSCKIDTRLWRCEYTPGFQRRLFGCVFLLGVNIHCCSDKLQFYTLFWCASIYSLLMRFRLCSLLMWLEAASIAPVCQSSRYKAYEMAARLMPIELTTRCMPGFLRTSFRRWLLCRVSTYLYSACLLN